MLQLLQDQYVELVGEEVVEVDLEEPEDITETQVMAKEKAQTGKLLLQETK